MSHRMSFPTVFTRMAWPALVAMASVSAFVWHPLLLDLAAFPHEGRLLLDKSRALLAVASYFSIAWLAGRIALLVLEKANPNRRLPKLLRESITAVLFLTALLASFALTFDGPVAGALATSGVVVAVLGFALRNVIADIVLGMALGLERSYRIGDWLEADNGIGGLVVEINWRTTRLVTRNQVHVIMPNSRIAQQRLKNYSAPRPHYRDEVRVCLGHAVPVAEAKKVLLAALGGAKGIRSDPAPDVRVTAFSPMGIVYAVRYWVPSYADEVDCRDAVLSALDTAMRAAGIQAASAPMVAAVGERH